MTAPFAKVRVKTLPMNLNIALSAKVAAKSRTTTMNEEDDLQAVELDREAVAIACRVMTDTHFKKPYMKDALPHRWVVEAVMAGIAHGKFIAGQQHQLIEEGQADQHETLQTSLIRAGMAAVCEAVMDGKYIVGPNGSGQRRIAVTINLEAQRTIWDRVELTTARNADETEVIFTVERK